MNFFLKNTVLVLVILAVIGTVYAPVYSPGVAERIIKNALVEVKRTGTIKDVAQLKQAYQDLPRMIKEDYQDDYENILKAVQKSLLKKENLFSISKPKFPSIQIISSDQMKDFIKNQEQEKKQKQEERITSANQEEDKDMPPLLDEEQQEKNEKEDQQQKKSQESEEKQKQKEELNKNQQLQEKANKERLEQEKQEQNKQLSDKEKIQNQEKQEKEKQEKERLEREKQKKETLEKELLEKQKLEIVEKEKLNDKRNKCTSQLSVIIHNTTNSDLQVQLFYYAGLSVRWLYPTKDFLPQDIPAQSFAVVCLPRGTYNHNDLIVSPKDTFLKEYQPDEYNALETMGRLIKVSTKHVAKDSPLVIEINQLQKDYECSSRVHGSTLKFSEKFNALLKTLGVTVTDKNKK